MSKSSLLSVAAVAVTVISGIWILPKKEQHSMQILWTTAKPTTLTESTLISSLARIIRYGTTTVTGVRNYALTVTHEIWKRFQDATPSSGSSTATAQWVAEKVTPETFALFDFVNVMAYDNDEDKHSHASYEYSVKCLDYFHNRKKIPEDKLVLGVPFYGRGYTADGEIDWNSYMSFADIVNADNEYYNADNYNGIAYNGAETMKKKQSWLKTTAV